jgi:hypothetical protein
LQNFRKNCCEISYFGGEWCNGSTTDSDSVCLGSNPSSPAKSDAQTEFYFSVFFLRRFGRRLRNKIKWLAEGGIEARRSAKLSSIVRNLVACAAHWAAAYGTAGLHTRQINKAYAFVNVGPIRLAMADDFDHQIVLFKPPLLRHLRVERMVNAAVELVDIHRLEPLL